MGTQAYLRRQDTTHCRNGHALTDSNIYSYTHADGQVARDCRACKRKARVEYNRSTKLEVFSHYGTTCACCGESRQEFLAIDHINGGGRQHSLEIGKSGTGFYSWLKQQGYPEGYRVLCHNCNMSWGFFGYCPHEEAEKCVV